MNVQSNGTDIRIVELVPGIMSEKDLIDSNEKIAIKKIRLRNVCSFLLSFSFNFIKAVICKIGYSLLWLPKKLFNCKLTLNFFVFITLCAIITYVIYCIVKSRVLSQYKKLIPDFDDSKIIDDSKETKKQNNDKNKPAKNQQNKFDDDLENSFFSSYLDQFLSAIKIFGYLEKPVFHDLTKNMKTQKLDEGEILLLDNSIGFAIVVEGTLQIYHEVENDSLNITTENISNYLDFPYDNESEISINSSNDSINSKHGFLENDTNGYIHLKNGLGKFQLLNTVKPGNSVSSLATILSLFTNTSLNNDNNELSTSSTTNSSRRNSIQNQLVDYTLQNKNKYQINSTTTDFISESPLDTKDKSNLVNLGLPMPNVVARAATDCTIAIIPPQAFLNLTKKYPRSVCHIIQIILTKVYHVTFQTVHKYLGLTSEIMQMEYLLNKSTNYELPNYLKDLAIEKLDSNLELQPSSIKSNLNKNQSKTNISIGNNTIEKNDLNKISKRLSPHLSSRHVVLDSRDHLNPGDLLSNAPLPRKEIPLKESTNNLAKEYQQYNKLRQLKKSPLSSKRDIKRETNELISFSSPHDETVDSTIKMAIIEAIFTYLNINETNMSVDSLRRDSIHTSISQTSINRSPLSSHRPSDISLISSFASSTHPRHTLRILPSDFAIKSPKVKHARKITEYKEEIPSGLNYESAKTELSEAIQLKYYKQGTTIVEQDKKGKGLFYIIKGRIDVTLNNDHLSNAFPTTQNSSLLEKSHRGSHVLFTIEEGGIAGYLTSLVNYRSFVGLRAKTDVYTGYLPNAILERLCDKYFLIYLRLAESLTSLLSPRMLKLDHALEWVHLSASETLFNQGDPANGIYVVLNGRLRQFQKTEANSNSVAVGEMAQDESFGELEVLTATNRSSTIVAIRDSELARIPRTLFETLALEHPSIMVRVSRLVANKLIFRTSETFDGARIIGNNGNKYDFNLTIPPTKTATHLHSYHNTQSTYSRSRTYRTITILPVSDGIPVEQFASKLVNAFRQVGRTTISLNQRTTLTHLGRHAFDRLGQMKQSGYFTELEQLYQTVVYVADPSLNSSWTNTCISQGDCILLLANAAGSPEIGEYEKLLLQSNTTARTELILLHPERYVEPGLTHKWLILRPWVDSHHHIEFSVNQYGGQDISTSSKINESLSLIDKIIQTDLSRKTQHNISKLLPGSIKSKVENFSLRFMRKKVQYYSPLNTYKDDFLRLARILSGQAIGLVLGGGGAKGISHLGVIQALEEQGIPVDFIGGTSIGSFVGGLYAKDYNMLSIFGRTKKFCGRISSIWRMITDLTWPVTSYTTGHEFNRGIWKTFGDTRIEDFWLPYFCNSTNITESVQEIHSFGYAWRYIRASMSLAGFLPPLEENGSMLLDGGYVDNLPVWEMKARGCDTIFAIDVGSMDDRTPMAYGDSLNGFWIIFNRWNPFSTHPNIPDLAEIQLRLGYVASVNALEKAKHTKGVIYARPPIDGYNTLEFSKFEEIYQLGLRYGRCFFKSLKDDGKMPIIPGTNTTKREIEAPEFLLHRRNSI